MNKNVTRTKRATKTRMKIRELGIARLCINRTGQHIYAQLIEVAEGGDKVIASASTLDKEIKAQGAKSGNIKSASIIGKFIAQRSLAKGIKRVAFDRSGFKYHGCIKALAEAAREAGLQF